MHLDRSFKITSLLFATMTGFSGAALAHPAGSAQVCTLASAAAQAPVEPLPDRLVVPYAEPFDLPVRLTSDTQRSPDQGTGKIGATACMSACSIRRPGFRSAGCARSR